MKNPIKTLVHSAHMGYLRLRRMLAPRWTVRHSKILNLDLLLQPSQLVDFIIWKYGVFEPEVIGMLQKVCPTDQPFLFVDVGSHLGQFSLYVARHYPQAKVLSFEPNPEVYQQQAMNQQLNQLNYSLYPYALGQQEGKIDFYLPTKEVRDAYGTSNNGLACSTKPTYSHYSITVEQKSAGGFLKKELQEANPLIIKLDVEGHEQAILKSLLPELKGKKVFLILEMLWKDEAERCEQLHTQLIEEGFNIDDGRVKKKNGNYLYGR